MPQETTAEFSRIRAAWQGRVSGCILGKPLEVLSFQEGRTGISQYLNEAGALPLEHYVPVLPATVVERTGKSACKGCFNVAEPDDDINYTVLALMMLEAHGASMTTEDVARAWLTFVPGGTTWTAERATYRVLLNRMDDEFVNGAAPGFDLGECSAHDFNEWIGAQIRADLYGWVCPGRPALAAELATQDASLSHRDDGIHGAAFVAALGASIPAAAGIDDAIRVALRQIPTGTAAADAILLAMDIASRGEGPDRLHTEFETLSPVHTLNNLALVVWALCRFQSDFSAAICNVVMAGWDTDCNGATVGGLLGLAGVAIPEQWTQPWNGLIRTNLAGIGELKLDDLVQRTLTVANQLNDKVAA